LPALRAKSAPRRIPSGGGECVMVNDNAEPEDEQPIRKEQAKKPYIKPAFRFERVFETTALSCGKVSPTEFLCAHNRKAS
jgi:hypothetical protein